ncbi:hypothetical protein [Empedobacter sp. R132-2]|uniref:hypothetical protein n=1 Tax=Empedobacter sp. R132-2 TaxID=2746740 RepID=UPI00257820A7|nr:hypothetical protein [Empedobacter sp. R132-2]MDM1137825.1 hypothetical protein [Empedobacter sp. R132-2]
MKIKISRLLNPVLYTIAVELSTDTIGQVVDLDDVLINTEEYEKYNSYYDFIHLMLNIYEFNDDYLHFQDIINDIKNNNIDSYNQYIFDEYSIFKNLDLNDNNQISDILITVIDDLYLSVNNDEERLICLIKNTVLSIEYFSNNKKESTISSRNEPFESFTYLSILQLNGFNSLKMEVDEESFGSGNITFLVTDYHKEVILKISNIISSIEKSDFYSFRNLIMVFEEEINIAFEEYDDERNNIDYDDLQKFINLIEKNGLDFIYDLFKVDLDYEELDFYNTTFFEYSYLIIDIYNHIHDSYFKS